MEMQRLQIDKQEERHLQQQRQFVKQKLSHRQQMEALINPLGTGSHIPVAPSASVPSFAPFDPTSKLWKDYRARFHTFVGDNSIPNEKIAQVFLTNLTTTTYKLLCALARHQALPQDINRLTMDDIANFIQTQFDPKQFMVRNRFK